jgi:hypothetical protein
MAVVDKGSIGRPGRRLDVSRCVDGIDGIASVCRGTGGGLSRR